MEIPVMKQGPVAGAFIGAPVIRRSAAKDFSHDVKAMRGPSQRPVSIYICNPNNQPAR